ncbi:carbonic anhydrase [Conexibacter woesei]|uniref:Carbonic anhydrase n=1 Tax=Conexibacter woesei (strain DSM 14684 / CCUG 47730 / CIP 108061 / JCM 11494 / NBRC 100937 / ID131577) TaxID=469383 RepID=D3FAB2_CONWI|nr:carbonic anhydrase [Conexibacter woesei]ADB49181.1 Carbonate dehydratase [Conexibacter woesei DSM 14684]
MRNLLAGIHDFQREGFRSQRTLMERLAVEGQRPQIALVSCSDSRVLPEMFTQAAPGDIFLVRNAGNIVPAATVANGAPGEAASLEFAVEVLGVRDVVVCGHTHCGAVDAILNPETIAGLPNLERWLLSSQETGRIVRERYGHLEGDSLMRVAVAEHVLVQLEHLRALPFIARRLEEPDFAIHGWVYDIVTGEVVVYDVDAGRFRDLD